MTKEYSDYLAHYGVKGQKWGVRNYQNEDGSYTTAGAERYWGGGHGRQPGSAAYQAYKQARRQAYSGTSEAPKRQIKKQATKEQIEARKKRTRIVIGAAAGLAVAGLAAYGIRKGATKLRDSARADVYKRDYLDAVSRNKLKRDYPDKVYTEYLNKQMKYASGKADAINRRNAVMYWMKKGRRR